MTISFYDASVTAYLQILGGVANTLDKGAQYAAENDLDLVELLDFRLKEDMLPFSFQLVSVWHHSLGAVNGMKAGEFAPPPALEALDYGKLQGLITEAIESLQAMSADEINALADQPMVFKVGGNDIPFTTTNFLLSFSLPNFHFHAATTYDILRMQGVPLGKMDFLGALRVGAN